ncbi:hypothetical protein JNW91_03245 [Micromonospora sp. STR1_7]|uniref:Uncharacterized protein n=1 Tax=Micromonospora parastrephiae TaxID=2806101 RepID=A0ABS1XP54_9ACTN|nr:hypothetical protein [Micromonospora parastrephiae]MBM0230979.1 hypothetical protein [Micromonospora parastrephiae]
MYELLKVLGMTAMVIFLAIHRLGEKVGGLPVDNRWTTVDNRPSKPGCGHRRRLYPRFSTAKSPVDNLSELRELEFSTVCTGAMKTMSYLF